MGVVPVHTESAPAPVGPYSQGTRGAGLVFVSGQLGISPSSGKFPPSVEDQAVLALENLKSILEAGGSSMELVLKVTVLLADMKDFSVVNAVYSRYFKEPHPARIAYEVPGLPLGGLVEIDAIALSGKD